MYGKSLQFLFAVSVFLFSEASVIKMEQELNTATAPKVQVVVYSQSLDATCHKFLVESMVPTVRHLGDIMNLTYLAFGNGNEEKQGDNYTFTCEDGPQECYGNIVETCALHHYPNLTNTMDFMVCFEEDLAAQQPPVWSNSLRKCAKPFGIGEEKIARCVKGKEGMMLEHAVAEQTGYHFYTPWALVDGFHWKWGEFTLGMSVCYAYKGPKPAYCNQFQ